MATLFTIRLIGYTQLFLTLLTSFGDTRDGFPCTVYRGECRAHMEFSEGQSSPTLEVSCQCKYGRDVSRNLTALLPILCPLVPSDSDSPKLEHSILRIENCDVMEEAFPLKMLRILRRSKMFSISVKNVKTLRLESDTEKEEGTQPAVQAHFMNSHISELGPGWFTNSDNVSVQIVNCTVEAIEAQFITNHVPNATVGLEFENTEIKTVKSFAFFLPREGNMAVKGGKILEVKTGAIEGGKSLSFEAVTIDSIEVSSINIYGQESFTMDSCIVERICRKAIEIEKHLGLSGPKLHPEFHVGEVVIKFNKFMDIDRGAFASFCREKNFTFGNNFLNNVTSTVALKLRHCSRDRNWWVDVGNNGFVCNNCQNLKGDVDEQVCAVYETGWCLCDKSSSSDTWRTMTLGKYGEKSPCRVSVRDYVNKHCTGTNKPTEYLSKCKLYSEKIPKLSPRSLEHSPPDNSGTTLSSVIKSFMVSLLGIGLINLGLFQ